MTPTPTPSDAQPVKRYSRYARGEIVEDRSGPWVKFSDHQSTLDAERQKREAAEREIVSLRSEIDCYETEKEDLESEFTKAEEYHASSLAKANARIAESDWQPVETLPKDGRSVMVWLAATATERPHAFAPVSVCEDGSWWDDSTGDQIEPFSAVYWKPIQPPNALSNIEKERGR